MRKAWFCYEASATGPAPVIHYDSLPNAKNSLNPRILQTHELGMHWFDDEDIEVYYTFSHLCHHFPYTGNEYDTEKTFSLDHKEAAE